MFSSNAYCFCPDLILDRIGDYEFFSQMIMPSTVCSAHHVLLDEEEVLWLEYLKRCEKKPTAFQNLQTWKKSMQVSNGKLVHVKNVDIDGKINADFLADLTIKAPITSRKYIVTSITDSYTSLLNNLKVNGVDILSEFNLRESANAQPCPREYRAPTFFDDLVLALSKVSSTRSGKSENEHNDYLRDLLSMRSYDVYDQSRLGKSESGKNIGSLDLIIKDREHWVTILEPLKLSSIESSNIISHYNKLIDNYNPLRLIHTHLIVYYSGKKNNFNKFYDRYLNKVTSLSSDDFIANVKLEEPFEIDNRYQAIKSFIQKGEVNGSDFHCYHTCICFS